MKFGLLEQLWNGSPYVWRQLIDLQQEEHHRANEHTRGRRVKWEFNVGDRVWLWNTKTVTLKDKLDPWSKGLGRLVKRVSRSVWVVRGPYGRNLTRHTDMPRPYRE